MLQRLLAGLARDRWVPRQGYKVLTSKLSPKMRKGRGSRTTGVYLGHKSELPADFTRSAVVIEVA